MKKALALLTALVLLIACLAGCGKTGSSGDPRFIDAFVTASLTVCIGAMSIVGAIQDGVSRDYSTLAVKAVLDCVIIAVMTASLGKGCIFSAIPVFVLEGAVTLLAQLLAPALTELAVSYLSLIGSILISSGASCCG